MVHISYIKIFALFLGLAVSPLGQTKNPLTFSTFSHTNNQLLKTSPLFAKHQHDLEQSGFFSNQISDLKAYLIKDFHQTYNGQEVFATYTYDNTTSGTLNNQNSCNTTLQRTFNVRDNFTINDLNVGLNMAHTWRGDVQVTLTSPSNRSVVVVAFSGDNFDGYNMTINDESGNAINDNNNYGNGTPYYNRSVSPSNPLSAFDGEQANGTWTLTFCNDDQGSGSNGRTLRFYSAQLIFDGTAGSGGGSTYTGEICNNGIDDDGDGDIDCSDSDCVTINGYVSSVVYESGVDYEYNLLGAPDGNFAAFEVAGHVAIVDLEYTLSEVDNYSIRWKNDYFLLDGRMKIEESQDGVTWRVAAGSPFTITSRNYYNTNIQANGKTRYLRLTIQNNYDVEIDAISFTKCYTSIGANGNTGGGNTGGDGNSTPMLEDCGNGIDDDGDGFTDCSDSECDCYDD